VSLPEIVTVYAEPLPKVLGLVSPPTVRRFSNEALQAEVDKVLAGLPADKRAAELSVGFDQQGVQVVGVVKLDHGWSILGGVSYDYGGAWGGKVGVRWAGK
jgi:hypothetical protein